MGWEAVHSSHNCAHGLTPHGSEHQCHLIRRDRGIPPIRKEPRAQEQGGKRTKHQEIHITTITGDSFRQSGENEPPPESPARAISTASKLGVAAYVDTQIDSANQNKGLTPGVVFFLLASLWNKTD